MTDETRTKNLAIWERNKDPNPAHVKEFTRGGGFKGKSTNATHLAQMATEEFGPMGIGWGLELVSEELMQGAGETKIHKVVAKLWYMHEGKRGEITQFGQTEFCGKRGSGSSFTDEEAPKKSLTDAMTKCLSLLGFGAAIHMGMWDDNKYLNSVRQEYAEEARQQRDQANDNRQRDDRRDDPRGDRRDERNDERRDSRQDDRGDRPRDERPKNDPRGTDDRRAGPTDDKPRDDGKSINYDDAVALEQDIRKKIDAEKSSSVFIKLMRSDDIVAGLKTLPEKVSKEIHSYASDRYRKLVADEQAQRQAS